MLEWFINQPDFCASPTAPEPRKTVQADVPGKQIQAVTAHDLKTTEIYPQ